MRCRCRLQKHVPEWRSFVRETARHFKGRIPVYEIWNEENQPGFWSNPDAGSCVQVLRAAYEEIKAIDGAAVAFAFPRLRSFSRAIPSFRC